MATDEERLLVRIEAQLRQFEKAMGQATRSADKAAGTIERRFKTMESRVARVGSGLAGAFGVGLGVGAVRELTRSIRGIVKETADLGDQADRIGLTAERLQELNFQATQTGASAETMASGLETFSKRVSEAQEGTGDLLKLFKANNVELRNADGTLRPLNDLLTDYINLIGSAANASDRLNIATKGFGRGAGADLALTFAGGAKAAGDFADQAHRTSQIIDNELVKSAQEIDDKFDQLTGTISTMIKGGLLQFLATTQKEIQGIASAIGAVEAAAHNAGQTIASEHLKHLRDLKARGLAPGVVLPFPGKEKDDLVLPPTPTGSRAQFPGKEKDDLARFTVIPADKIEESAKAREHSAAAIDREARSLSSHNEELVTQNFELERNDDAQQQLIDRMDEFRFAASSSLDSFVSAIESGQGAAAGLKAALIDVLHTVIQLGEQKAIASLFGLPGTGGGGFLGGFLGKILPGFGGLAPAASLAGVGAMPNSFLAPQGNQGGVVEHRIVVDASPLLIARQETRAQEAEDRAVGRAPAVARYNSRRFGTP